MTTSDYQLGFKAHLARCETCQAAPVGDLSLLCHVGALLLAPAEAAATRVVDVDGREVTVIAEGGGQVSIVLRNNDQSTWSSRPEIRFTLTLTDDMAWRLGTQLRKESV